LGNIRLEWKLTIAYSAVVLLSVVLLFAVIYVPFAGYLRENAVAYHYSMMETANRDMDRRYLDLDRLSTLIIVDSKVQEYLEQIQSFDMREKYDRTYALEAAFGNILRYNSDLSGIYVISSRVPGLVKADYQPYRVDANPAGSDYFAEFVLSDNDKTAFFGEGADEGQVIYLRKIYGLQSGKVVGFLQLSSRLGTSLALSGMASKMGERALGVADTIGRIAYFEGSAPDEQLYEVLERSAGTGIVRLGSKIFLLSSYVSETFGWRIFSMTPVDKVIPSVARILTFVSGACVVVFLLLSFFSARIAVGITRPLKRLAEDMSKVRGGNFEVSARIESHDEIGQLSESFHDMLQRIKTLIEQVYLLDIKEKEAELIALQNQIEPHFLHNTLESIRNMAVLNDDDETARIIAAFGKFLRFRIYGANKIVTLGEELEHAISYVELMQMKYAEKLIVAMSVPPHMLRLPIVKLTLQPIVENAIRHGMTNRLHIGITGTIDDNGFHLTVADDGRGIPEEQLAAIRLGLGRDTENEMERQIGLRNVHTRTKLAFGADYGLEVESQEGAGTVVTVKLPLTAEVRDE
jgi:sensor histidine kinase YesM